MWFMKEIIVLVVEFELAIDKYTPSFLIQEGCHDMDKSWYDTY